MKCKFYYLVGKTPVMTTDVIKWGIEFEKNRLVQQTKIGDILVSTVFLGLNHRFREIATLPPILFETMIFGGVADDFQERYETWEQAEAGHKKAVYMVLGMVSLETEILKKAIIKSLN